MAINVEWFEMLLKRAENAAKQGDTITFSQVHLSLNHLLIEQAERLQEFDKIFVEARINKILDSPEIRAQLWEMVKDTTTRAYGEMARQYLARGMQIPFDVLWNLTDEDRRVLGIHRERGEMELSVERNPIL